jgi:peptidase E
MGGGGILRPDSKLEGLLLELAVVSRPRICFLPTAGGESPEQIQCFYDAFGPELRELGGGLGLLAGSFCPHYDGEPERRPTYTRLVRDSVLPPGYAADDYTAFHFEGTELREVVRQRDGAHGYRVTAAGEEPIEARLL